MRSEDAVVWLVLTYHVPNGPARKKLVRQENSPGHDWVVRSLDVYLYTEEVSESSDPLSRWYLNDIVSQDDSLKPGPLQCFWSNHPFAPGASTVCTSDSILYSRNATRTRLLAYCLAVGSDFWTNGSLVVREWPAMLMWLRRVKRTCKMCKEGETVANGRA